MKHHRQVVVEALGLLSERCPRLVSLCYWAGTCAVAVDGLEHRISHDLDFHTKRALLDVRPVLAEVERAFPGAFQLVQAPDAYGSGFSGVLELPSGNSITLEVLSNYEDTPDLDLIDCKIQPGLSRVSLSRYLADKIQCVAERAEARDLVDIQAVLEKEPSLEAAAKKLLREQDAILLVERLMSWTDERITKDLVAYPDIPPVKARISRDVLLGWLKEEGIP